MAGRRDDITPGHLARSVEARSVEPPARGRRLRTVGLVAGLLLAVAATAAVLVTDEARYLRIALLACCWAFLVAAFLAGGRRADQLAARGREAELRHAYDLELEREVAARQAHELELERRLRAESEAGMRRELAALRADLAGLSGLRTDLAALGELRADLGRLRTELTDQLSGELLIERMVMRAQSVRLPADRTDEDRSLDGVPDGAGLRGAARALTDAVPAARPAAAADRAGPPPVLPELRPAVPPTAAPWQLTRVEDQLATDLGSAPRSLPADPPGGGDGPPAPVEPAPDVHLSRQVSRPAVSPRPGPRWEPASPAQAPWPAPSSRPGPAAAAPPSIPPLVPGPTTGRPTPAPRSRHGVGTDPLPPAVDTTAHRHHRAAAPDDHRLPADGHARLEQILADNGVSPAPGRRRRYRDEDDPPPRRP